MNRIKNFHETVKELSKITEEDMYITKYLGYPIWVLVLLLFAMFGKGIEIFGGDKR